MTGTLFYRYPHILQNIPKKRNQINRGELGREVEERDKQGERERRVIVRERGGREMREMVMIHIITAISIICLIAQDFP